MSDRRRGLQRPHFAATAAAGLLLIAASWSSSCGGDEGTTTGPGPDPGTPSESVTMQERLEVSAFEALYADSADLATLGQGLSLTEAGVVEDSAGRTVHWAEGTDSGGALRTAVRHCDAGACLDALQTIADGQASWALADGTNAETRTLGAPASLKDLIGHDLGNKTTVAAALTSSKAGALTLEDGQVPAVDFHTRRFVAINTFGALFGTRTTTVTAAASSHGGFDSVETVDYVREGTVAGLLRDLDGTDAVFWLSQGVRQEVKDGWRSARTVGLTVNRGGFGERIMTRDALDEAAAANIGAGPGIVFLGASQSFGDGTEGMPDNGAVWPRLDDPDRVLVGLEGHADTGAILAAAQRFFDLYLSGEVTLGDALDAGTEALAASGARLVTNRIDLTGKWLRRLEDVWDDAPFQPSAVQITAPITAVPYCGPAGGQKQPTTSPDALPFADVTFDGSRFEGTKQVDLGDVSVDIHFEGVVTGFGVGDRILFEVWGDFSKSYKGFRAFGEGLVREVVTDEDGTVRVLFDGPVHAAPYTNDAGQECILNSPQLSTKTSELAELRLTP